MIRVILGIDPGFGRMGFGCVRVSPGKIVLLGAGVITTSPKIVFSQRLVCIHEDVTALLKKYQPSLVAIEKLYFAQNTTTAMRVAEARGVAQLAIAQAGLEVRELAPAQIKLALTGDGKADKRAMQKMVKILLNLPRVPKPDDAADALAIALTASTMR